MAKLFKKTHYKDQEAYSKLRMRRKTHFFCWRIFLDFYQVLMNIDFAV